MKTLRTLFNLVVLSYVVFSTLLLSTLLKENEVFKLATEQDTIILYKLITGGGVFLLLVKLLISHLYVASLKHEQHLQNLKINELRANLYEKRQEFRSNSYKLNRVEEAAEMSIH